MKAVGAVESQDAVWQDREFTFDQRSIWALGDYHEFARRSLWGFGQQLVEACGIGPGQRVLDVGAGTGNVAIRAALTGAEVVASDLTPENFEAGRREAAAQGARLEWVQADAEALPFADGEFDAVTSAFGAIFAGNHQAVADELLRVCRPGGTIGLTAPALPAGKAGLSRMFADLPSVFGTVSPLQWGDEHHVSRLFGERIESLDMHRRRTELTGFAGETELRDFLKANHPVTVAAYRDAGDDPDAVEMLDDALLGTINLWYARDGESGSLVQEAMFVVARKRSHGSA